MTVRLGLLSLVIAGLGAAAAPSSYAAPANSWDGIWTGMLDDQVSISIRVANNKPLNYAIKGTPIGITFSKVSGTSLEFGDTDHYRIDLKRTGDATATASYFGRHGYSITKLTRTKP
jgi:hypothetical protein